MKSAKLAIKLGNEVGVIVVVGDQSKANLIINRGIESWTAVDNHEPARD
jgi:hypothetical protein